MASQSDNVNQITIQKIADNLVTHHPQDDNLRAIGKFTHMYVEDIKRRGFCILYDDKGNLVNSMNQFVLIADDAEQFLNPELKNINQSQIPHTNFTKITTRVYDDNSRFCDDDTEYFYIEYRINPTLNSGLVATPYPLISIKDRRCLQLVVGQCGQIRKYNTCCKTHYLIVSDKNRLEPKNIDDIFHYKHCKEVKFSYISLQLLGFCECTVHVISIGCHRKHCC